MYSVIILKQGLEFTEVLWDCGYQKLGRKVGQEREYLDQWLPSFS